ncbi:MAG TPA: ImcF-related family protein [Fibrobacteria bacterium]|nr:ImcF-related family protein [Fibrobacteria bacterium]
MRTLKSFWFWFMVVWFLLGATASLILAIKFPPWTWIHTAGAVVWFLVGSLVGLFLRQRALIASLSKGSESTSQDTFQESWKTSFASDLAKLAESAGSSKDGGINAKRLVWTLSPDVDQAKTLLEAAGATDITAGRSHELSGEFLALASWLVRKDEIYILLREMPDPRVEGTLSRTRFLLEQLGQRGKVRAVDAALVISPLSRGQVPQSIHAALGFLADQSGVEFPIYAALHGAEGLLGGNVFYRQCPEPPGAALPWCKQEDLPGTFDQSWQRLEKDIDAKENGHLALAWENGGQAPQVFQFLDLLRTKKDSVRAIVLSCATQFVGKTRPFLRGYYLLPSPEALSKTSTPSTPAPNERKPAAEDLGFFGGAFAGPGTTPEPVPTSSPIVAEAGSAPAGAAASWEFLLERIHGEPAIARLGAHRQIQAGTLSLAIFGVALLVSFLGVWAAMHGWVVGGKLQRSWNARLSVDRAAQWTDRTTMQSSLNAFDDIDQLVESIRHGRPWLLAPGFYRDGSVLPQAQTVWDTMTHRLMAEAFQAQEQKLRSLVGARDTLGETRELYGALKAYLLITKSGWADGESSEGEKGLTEAIVRVWSNYFGYTDVLPTFERDLFPRIAARIAARIDDGDSSFLGPQDAALVFSARLQLKNSKNQSGTYSRILAVADTIPKLTWDSLGMPTKEITCRPMEIPGAFTRRGWLESIQPAIDAMSEGGKDWVMGNEAQAADLASSSQVVAEVERRYVEDFEKAWRQVMDTTVCMLPADNQRMGATLTILASPYMRQNPKGLQALFNRFLEETDLRPPKDTATTILPKKAARMAAKAAKLAAAAGKLLDSDLPVEEQILRRFDAPRKLANDVTKGFLDNYVKDLGLLGGVLSQWSGGEAAVQFARGITSQANTNPLVHGWTEANGRRESLPAELRPWFNSLTIGMLRQAAGRVFPEAQAAATASYKEKVFQPWQNLSRGNYPFDSYAETEASINDIDAMLNPRTGSLAVFLKEIEGLVQVQNGDIRPVSSNGMGLALDPQAVDQLRKLMKIANYFYGVGGTTWRGVNATLKVRADQRARVTLRVGSQTMDIPQGTERTMTIRWPLPGQAGVVLQSATIHQSFEERREGEWALLRLIDSKNPGSSEATWSFMDLSYIVDVPLSVRLDPPGGPFTDREFFHVSLPQNLFR